MDYSEADMHSGYVHEEGTAEDRGVGALVWVLRHLASWGVLQDWEVLADQLGGWLEFFSKLQSCRHVI